MEDEGEAGKVPLGMSYHYKGTQQSQEEEGRKH